MDLSEIQSKGQECKTLKDAYELELSYDNSHGTPTDIQDYFRELKASFVIAAFKECNLENSMLKFYNYSMQGYCQVFFDESYHSRVTKNLNKLEELLDVPVTIRNHREEVVISMGVFNHG